MKYSDLEKIAKLLYGNHWIQDLCDALGVKKHSVQNWKRQGVADWVKARIYEILENRDKEINLVKDILYSIDE